MNKSDKNKKLDIKKFSENPDVVKKCQESLRNMFDMIHADGDMKDVDHSWKKYKEPIKEAANGIIGERQ